MAATPLTARARIALATGNALRDVEGLRVLDDPLRRTVAGGTVVPGVVAAAGADGLVEVAVHADLLEPLRPIEELRHELERRLAHEVDAAGVREQLGELVLHLHDVAEDVPCS